MKKNELRAFEILKESTIRQDFDKEIIAHIKVATKYISDGCPNAKERFRADIRPYLERKVAPWVRAIVEGDLIGEPVEMIPCDYFDIFTTLYFKTAAYECVCDQLDAKIAEGSNNSQ